MVQIPEERVLGIAESLLQKSRNNEVEWSQEGTNDYVVDLAGFRVLITFFSPETEPDSFHFLILDKAGRTVGRVEEYAGQANDGGTLRSLYYEAGRYVTKWDSVLAQIEQELNKSGKVGTKVELKASNTRVAVPDHDDIPF